MARKPDESGESMAVPYPEDAATAIDRRVSERLSEARKSLGLSLSALGRAAGVSYQQIQKYESGRNRISCGTLAVLATYLERPVGWFFAEDIATPNSVEALPDPVETAVSELLAAVRQSRQIRRQAES